MENVNLDKFNPLEKINMPNNQKLAILQGYATGEKVPLHGLLGHELLLLTNVEEEEIPGSGCITSYIRYRGELSPLAIIYVEDAIEEDSEIANFVEKIRRTHKKQQKTFLQNQEEKKFNDLFDISRGHNGHFQSFWLAYHNGKASPGFLQKRDHPINDFFSIDADNGYIKSYKPFAEAALNKAKDEGLIPSMEEISETSFKREK